MADSHEELNRARSAADGAALAEQRCETCRFWLLLATRHDSLCRRFPPIAGAGWPMTRAHQWCGEWWSKP